MGGFALFEPAEEPQFHDFAGARIDTGQRGADNPSFLHTLGWAQYRTGNRKQAVAILDHALTLLDPASAAGPTRGLRAQIENDLADFKAHRVS